MDISKLTQGFGAPFSKPLNDKIQDLGNGVLKISFDAIDDFEKNGRIVIPMAPEKISVDAYQYKRFSAILTALTHGRTARTFSFRDQGAEAPKEFQAKLGSILANSITDKNLRRCSEMFYEYNKALLQKGFYPDMRDTSGLDHIDIRQYTDYHDELVNQVVAGKLSEEDMLKHLQPIEDYVESSPFFSGLPCYSEGILDYSDTTGLYWKISKLNLDTHEAEIYCYFFVLPEGNKHLEEIVPYVDFVIEFHQDLKEVSDDPIPYKVYFLDKRSLTDMVQAISPKKFRWNQEDRLLWNNIIVKYVKLMDWAANTYGQGDEYGTLGEVVGELSQTVVECFCYINYILHSHKKTPRKRKTTDEKHEVHSFDKKKQEERKTTVVDGVVFYSKRRPQEVTRNTVVKYKVATWTVRGHTRTYKNGKTVYIPPHVNHRKNMTEVSEALRPAPRTIKVEKK